MAKILLVEDNEMNRDMLARRLERRGYQVVSAIAGHTPCNMKTPELGSRGSSPRWVQVELRSTQE